MADVKYRESKNGELVLTDTNSISDLDWFLIRAKKLNVSAFEYDRTTNKISFHQVVDVQGDKA